MSSSAALGSRAGRAIAASALVFVASGLPAQTPADLANQGRDLHEKILKSFPGIAGPAAPGGLMIRDIGNEPKAAILIPVAAWDKMSDRERVAIGCYAQSLIRKLKSSPEKYTDIPNSAPVFSVIVEKMSKMKPTDWEIVVGRATPAGGVMLEATPLAGGPKFDAMLKKVAR